MFYVICQEKNEHIFDFFLADYLRKELFLLEKRSFIKEQTS
ncbi:hypothetical protein BACI9J_130803 [Bacillus altitudinis]|nr:hypothetical protein BACI9J_130803 [Bacillus altitudinis]